MQGIVWLGDAATGRDNNFNLLRMLGAITVLVAHGYNILSGSIVSTDAWEQAVYNSGHLALNLFFVFSGFLIASSLTRNRDLVRFATARVLRLMPALLAASIFCVLIIGPIATTETLRAYFLDVATLAYVPVTTLTTHPDIALPGVFSGHPVPDAVNRPIWTLRYEIALYGAMATLAALGLLRRPRLLWATFTGALAVYGWVTLATRLRDVGGFFDHMAHFGVSFLVGAGFWQARTRVPLHWTAALLLTLAAVQLRDTAASELSAIIAAGYVYLYLAYVPANHFVRAYNRLGDYSYGVYVFHWPIAQLIHQLDPAIGPGLLILTTAAIAIPLAVVSWHLIEKPALDRVGEVSREIRSIASRMGRHRRSGAALADEG